MLRLHASAARPDPVHAATDVVWLRTAICGPDSRSCWLQRAERDLAVRRFGKRWLDLYFAHTERVLTDWLLATPYTGRIH